MSGARGAADRIARQPLDGVLLIDKPKGPGSTAVLARVKYLLAAQKAGHTGTLDPLASGLLPLCFGEATKFAQDLLDADKRYRAWLRLGVVTASGDAEGEVLARRAVDTDVDTVDRVIAAFVGDTQQVPPMYSALKKDGEPLYQLARRGLEVERASRSIRIAAIGRVAFEQDTLVLDVTCSKGTYIRVLAEDIGAALGCGAHLSDLRRTGVGTLDVAQAVSPQVLELEPVLVRQQRLLPLDALVSSLPRLDLDPSAARRFMQGQRIWLEGQTASPRLRVYGPTGAAGAALLGVALVDQDGVLRPVRVLQAKRAENV